MTSSLDERTSSAVHQTPPARGRALSTAVAVAAAAGLAVIGLSLRDVERDVLPQSTTPLGSDGGDLQPDPEVEERVNEEIAAFEATMGHPIPIAQGVDPAFGPWSIAVTISDGSLDNGFCVTGTAGGSCGVGADLDLFGLITRSGGPVPVVVWGAPMPITTVRVEWGDGTRRDVEVVRPPGESFGFAATVMPSVDAEFTSEGVDAAGRVVVSGVSDSHPYERVDR